VARALTRFNHCEFFLWGYLKDEVSIHRPQTLKTLKDDIREGFSAFLTEMTKIMMENFSERLRQFIANNGPPPK
jgi:hypothetical protein